MYCFLFFFMIQSFSGFYCIRIRLGGCWSHWAELCGECIWQWDHAQFGLTGLLFPKHSRSFVWKKSNQVPFANHSGVDLVLNCSGTLNTDETMSRRAVQWPLQYLAFSSNFISGTVIQHCALYNSIRPWRANYSLWPNTISVTRFRMAFAISRLWEAFC